MTPERGLAERVAWLVVGVAAAFALLLAADVLLRSPAGRVVLDDPAAPWIMAPEPFSAMNRQWGRAQAPPVRFERTFALAAVPAEAPLRVRAFGAFSVRINDEAIAFDAGGTQRWRAYRTRDVAGALRAGANRVVVEVRNRRGPALLSLAIELGPERVSTARGFRASVAGRPLEPAAPARDVRRHPAADWLPRPAHAAAAHARALALAAGLGAAVGLGLAHRRTRAGGWLVGGVAGLAAAFWGAVFVTRWLEMPLTVGFDARAHLDYVAQLAAGRLPLATDGWATYHPPLYHALVAALGAAGDAFGASCGVAARRLPAWGAGLGLVVLAGALARVLYPGRRGLAVWAGAFAAWLPMNLYMAGAITNEGLVAVLAAGAVVLGSRVMGARQIRTAPLLGLSVLLGLALLTKYTALVAGAVVGAFVLGRIVADESVSARARTGRALWLVAPAAVLAGWFYLRNVLAYGRPVVPNWDLPGSARTWWSPPGFHTPAYYTHFGRSLDEPFYAAFASFWDGLYSTFWGDGLLSGAPGLRHIEVPWSLEWMAIGYWLAVPLSALIALGLIAWARDLLRDRDPRRRGALAVPLVYLAAMGFALVYATFSLPFFGQARATYALSAVPVLAVGFARGIGLLDAAVSGRARLALFAALGALCGAFGLTVVLSFLGGSGR